MHEDINRLLRDFGNHLGLDSLALNEDGYSCLAFDEIYVNIEAIGESSWVLLYTSLGKVAHDAGQDVYMRLLEANYFFQQTAGASLGLETGTGLAVMTQAVNLADMESSDLEAVMKAFVDAAEGCAQLCNGVQGRAQPMTLPSSINSIILA